MKQKAPLSEIFKKEYRWRTARATLLWVFHTVAFFGFASFITLILIAKGFTIIRSVEFAGISSIGYLLGNLIFLALVERVERGNLIAIFAVTGAISSIVLAITNSIDLVILFSILIAAAGGEGAVLYLYTAELFPTRSRGTGSGFSFSMGRIVNVFSVLYIGLILAGNPALQLAFVAGSFIIVAIIGAVFRVKTSHLQLETISEYAETTEEPT